MIGGVPQRKHGDDPEVDKEKSKDVVVAMNTDFRESVKEEDCILVRKRACRKREDQHHFGLTAMRRRSEDVHGGGCRRRFDHGGEERCEGGSSIEASKEEVLEARRRLTKIKKKDCAIMQQRRSGWTKAVRTRRAGVRAAVATQEWE